MYAKSLRIPNLQLARLYLSRCLIKSKIIARKAVAPEMKIFADSALFHEYLLNFDLAPGILEFRVYTTGLARST